VPEWRRNALRAARLVAAAAVATEVWAAASAALTFDLRSVVIATLATALLAMTAFYSAYEGLDDALRRKP